MADVKKAAYASEFEVDSQHDTHLHRRVRTLRMLESARVGFTVLAMFIGLTILGVATDALAVYNDTHLQADYLLPLWPDHFNIRPTVALVVGSTIVSCVNAVSLVASKIQLIRTRNPFHTLVILFAPFIGLAAALVAIIMYYAANASDTTDTLRSWSCRWQGLTMTQRPRFDMLCRESLAGLYLAVLLVPVEAGLLALAGCQLVMEKYTKSYASTTKTGTPSPPLS